MGYISHPLRAYDSSPVWADDTQHMFYRDVVRGARHTGYAGRLGKESAAVLAVAPMPRLRGYTRSGALSVNYVPGCRGTAGCCGTLKLAAMVAASCFAP